MTLIKSFWVRVTAKVKLTVNLKSVSTWELFLLTVEVKFKGVAVKA